MSGGVDGSKVLGVKLSHCPRHKFDFCRSCELHPFCSSCPTLLHSCPFPTPPLLLPHPCPSPTPAPSPPLPHPYSCPTRLLSHPNSCSSPPLPLRTLLSPAPPAATGVVPSASLPQARCIATSALCLPAFSPVLCCRGAGVARAPPQPLPCPTPARASPLPLPNSCPSPTSALCLRGVVPAFRPALSAAGVREWPLPPAYLDTLAEGCRIQWVGDKTFPVLLETAEKTVFSIVSERACARTCASRLTVHSR